MRNQVRARRPTRRRRALRSLAPAALLLAVMTLAAAPARAVIKQAVTIDGPSEDIVGFGSVAMAEDGTGGAVYLKRVEGVPHVFVSRFIEGHWLPPIRVDYEEPFAAGSPRIGAAEGGELVVVWATPFATEKEVPVDELLGSTLGPGSTLFGAAQLIDPDIRDGTAVAPDLVMSSTGKADVVYRVVFTHPSAEQLAIPLLRGGDVIEDVRVAHYNGERWSRLGAINRNQGASMRPPSRSNAPQIAIGPSGNGVVAWQEPDTDGVARIWARRLFGASLDYVMPVSASSLAGAPITEDADAPSVAVSLLGQAEVAYRQSAGPGSPLPGPRVFLNTLPDGESASGAQFLGAAPLDLRSVSGGQTATVGPPDIDIDAKQNMRLLYSANGSPRVIEGTSRGLSAALTLGPGFAGPELFSASVMNPAGGGVSAWPSADAQGHPAIALREDFPDGAAQTGLLSGGAGGPIGELAVARSGLGDGIVGFLQGPLGNAAVVVAEATAPPTQLTLSAPKTWVKPSRASVSWLPATSADGPLSYRVVLDGHPLATSAGSLALRLDPRRVGDGRHRVQVLATDPDAQALLSPPAALLIDGQPPAVSISARSHGRALVVRVHDRYSGVARGSVRVSFGDGTHAHGRGRYSHRYRHAGVYEVIVRAGDRAANHEVVRRRVRVR
jgi:hypothetical protein